MGCDIHAVVFAHHRNQVGQPEPVIEFTEPRTYSLFSAMADVRNHCDDEPGYIAPVSLPRGLPNYVLRLTDDPERIDGVNYHGKWIGDHSFSWLTTDEFAEAIKRAESSPRCPMGVPQEYHAILAAMRGYEDRDHAAYLVFGFDN
jgi:hypothetical protein